MNARYFASAMVMLALAGRLAAGVDAEEAPALRLALRCDPFVLKDVPPERVAAAPDLKTMAEKLGDALEASGRFLLLPPEAGAKLPPTPYFYYAITAQVTALPEEGQWRVRLELWDRTRKERIGRISADLKSSGCEQKCLDLVVAYMLKKVRVFPFECAVTHVSKNGSFTLDAGRKSGLEPDMELELAERDLDLVDPKTGEIIGREDTRAIGRIDIFRVEPDKAYGRLTTNAPIKSKRPLMARSF